MKFFNILAIVAVGLGLGACSYKSETVQQPTRAATVVATPAPSGTVVYTDPAPASTTTVYTR